MQSSGLDAITGWLEGLPRPRQPQQAAEAAMPAVQVPKEESFEAIRVTGESLIRAVYDAIESRRPVLLTGPRGSGKSYCAEEGIRRAMGGPIEVDGVVQNFPPLIRNSKFMQGNREIPRDSLSEDSLFIGDDKRPDILNALALRAVGRPREEIDRSRVPGELPLFVSEFDARWLAERMPDEAKRRDFYKDREAWIKQLRTWPALPDFLPESLRSGSDDGKRLRRFWLPSDWAVINLDEINRFGDGFLDSLLSLTEEGKIVRRGDAYYVPLVVVATANPAGYDPTAKKLSPPLQARISRSYRVSQPGLLDLLYVVDDKRTQLFGEFANQAPSRGVQDGFLELAALACAATLLTWGDPGKEKPEKDDDIRRGAMYLTAATRTWLREIIQADRDNLAEPMKEISALIDFGCDARAVQDWIGRACELARGRTLGTSEVRALRRLDLAAAAVEVLGHKVRENFSEGASPEKVLQKEKAIVALVRRLMWPLDGTADDGPAAKFVKRATRAARRLAKDATEAAAWKAIKPLCEALHAVASENQLSWLDAIGELPSSERADWISEFKTAAAKFGRMQSTEEMEWFSKLFCKVRGIPPDQSPFRSRQSERRKESQSEKLKGTSGLALEATRLAEVHNDHYSACLKHEAAFQAWLEFAVAVTTRQPLPGAPWLHSPLLTLHCALLKFDVESGEGEMLVARTFSDLALQTCDDALRPQAEVVVRELQGIPWRQAAVALLPAGASPRDLLRHELNLRQAGLRLYRSGKTHDEVRGAMQLLVAGDDR